MSDVLQGTLSPTENRTELPSSPLHENQSPLHVRENLAGGTGVFANFFEEMADPNDQYLLRNSDHGEEFEASLLDNSRDGLFYDASPYQLCPPGVDPMHAYYDHCGQYKDDEDLNILGQYKIFVSRSRNENSFDPYQSYRADPSRWEGSVSADLAGNASYSEYLPQDFGSDLFISYAHRQKPPKVLASRFLLGQTIGRGSYGKVKDAIDLITLKRQAVKVISKLGVRKIPGGWSQALLEASVMRRLPASRHIVSLVAVLRVDNPDRLCLVMEHCLGSVHDLQSAGVPCLMDESDEEKYCGNEAVILERPDEGSDQPPDASSSPRTNHNSPSTRGRSNPAHTHRTGKHRFRLKCPIIETDLKRETTRCAEAFMNRKVSNVEASSHRKGSVLHSVHNQQQQQQQFRRLSEAQAHAYFLQLVDGLHFLHSHGVIHRDIKPANLLLTPAPGCGLSPLYSVADVMDAADSGWLDGNGGPSGFVGRSLRDLLNASRGWLIKLTDFGVSASLSTFCPNDLVSSGQTTPAVQPPEVAKGVQSVFIGTKLDVYSAGVTLYFMLTGRVPFSCGNVLQIFEAIAQGDYTIPGHVSSNAARLIRRMMTKDPNKRITLKEISQHPWVLGDPPAPLTLSEVRTKLRTQLENSMLTTGSPTSMRGMITWLDPLVYLRRPTREYPLPHIDDTGARIFTASELEEEEEEENETGSDSPQEIAPFSVLQRLQFYDALGEHTEEDEGNKPNQITSPILLPYTAGSHYIDAHLARLELSPGQSGDAICAEKCQPHCMSELKIRHSSGGAECLRPPNDLQSSSVQNSGGFRQRGVTISLPARADPGQTNRTSQYPPSGSSGLVSEPPACPADLPVSSVACFTPQPLLAICFGGTVGAVSCTDHLPNVMIERSPPSGSGSHSGFQLGSKLIQLSVDSFSQGKHSGDLSPCASGSHLTPDEQFVSDAPSATNTISRVDTWANCERMGGSVNSTGRRTVSGRFTRWFSRSLSSIQRRLYRLRDRARKRHGPDTEDDLDSHPPDSLDVSNSHTPDHRSMHDSVISDAISERQSSKTGKHGKRLLFRRKSVRSSEDGFT